MFVDGVVCVCSLESSLWSVVVFFAAVVLDDAVAFSIVSISPDTPPDDSLAVVLATVSFSVLVAFADEVGGIDPDPDPDPEPVAV